jgi:hypothetical protein
MLAKWRAWAQSSINDSSLSRRLHAAESPSVHAVTFGSLIVRGGEGFHRPAQAMPKSMKAIIPVLRNIIAGDNCIAVTMFS